MQANAATKDGAIDTDRAIVRMQGIHKSFGGVPVLRDVDFEVKAGEVHALAGGNGAGKSTLMKILQGVYSKDSGEIFVDGKETMIDSLQTAKAAGIGMVFQEFSLVPTLTVAQNISLTAEPQTKLGLIDDRASRAKAREILNSMGVDINPNAEIRTLSTAYWQLTEIAKALVQDARVLIMDEPSASLAKHEVEALFELIERLKAQGIAIIYISHRMDEVYRIADRITILRDGRRLLTKRLNEVTPEQIVEGIVGKQIEGQLVYQARDTISDEVLLEARGITVGNQLRDISFTVRKGEIVGLAGLMGSGRTELAQALFGVDRIDSGEILLRGKKVSIKRTKDAIDAGIVLVPEDRREQGLVLEHSVRENLLLPLLDDVKRRALIDPKRGREKARHLIEQFGVKVQDPSKPVNRLSGGNQQKVVIAKWLGTSPEVLILDEPTAGVDIGTKTEIVEMVRELADAGVGVIVISSEYPELLAVSDRILIMRRGAIVKNLSREDIPDEEALQLMVLGG